MNEQTRIRISRKESQFSAAHFLAGMGKCERLHGHNYGVTVEVAGSLGDNFTIIDFNELAPVIEKACRALDHKVLLAGQSGDYSISAADGEIEARFGSGKRFVFPESDCVILPMKATSVENLACHLAGEIMDGLGTAYPNIEWIEVGVSEGGSQMALCRKNAG